MASGIIPPLFTKDLYDDILLVNEVDARKTAIAAATQEGMFAGTSSGMHMFAAIELAKKLGKGSSVFTVACDSVLKYLAGDLFW